VEELERLAAYSQLCKSAAGLTPSFCDDGDSSSGGLGSSPPQDDVHPRGDSTEPRPNFGGKPEPESNPEPDGRSSALQDLYATDTVKDAFSRISSYNTPTMSDDDDEDDDDEDEDEDEDEEWEDNMDPITFMRYFSTRNPNPTIIKLVEDYDREEHAKFENKIQGWAAGIGVMDDAAEVF
jgi:hypothetical protein